MANSRTKAIRFIERQQVNYPDREPLIFEKDSVHELIDTSANRWIKRGVAVALTDDELKAHRKAVRNATKAAAAGNNDGNSVDSAKTLDGQNGGGDGQRAQPETGGRGFVAAVKNALHLG